VTPDVRAVARATALVLAGCATIAVAVVMLEERLIYFPSRYPDGWWDIAALGRETACAIEDRYFTTADGVRVHGWWCVPPPGDAPTATMALLWFHGNAGNLSHRADMLARLLTLPVRVLIVDYRGYGRSEGRPDEAGLHADARAAWGELTGPLGVPAEQVVILGKSLGGAVAVALAAEVRPAGLIVQSTFTSARDIAARVFPFVPAALIRTRLDSAARIGSVTCPKLFVHGTADEVVPYELGRRLFATAGEPKRWLDVPGAHHNDVYLVGGEAYLAALREFISACARHAGGDGGLTSP
jgi:fermentation-respiration switch protein FrsA (DUF1100 family)